MISNKQTVPDAIQLARNFVKREAMNMEVIRYILSLGIRMDDANFERIRMDDANFERIRIQFLYVNKQSE